MIICRSRVDHIHAYKDIIRTHTDTANTLADTADFANFLFIKANRVASFCGKKDFFSGLDKTYSQNTVAIVKGDPEDTVLTIGIVFL